MKNNKLFIGWVIALGTLIPFCTLDLQAEQDSIIAVVNDTVITSQDLHDYLNTIYMQLVADGKSKAEIAEVMAQYEKEGLRRIIDDRLLVNAAKERGMEIRPKLVDDRMNELKSRYPSELELIKALSEEGMTIGDLRKKIMDQMKARYIVDLEVREKIFVNPQDVTEYYEKNKNQFRTEERVDLDSIFIPYDKDRKKAQEDAQGALKLLQEGKDFTQVAKQYSKAPSIGMIEKGQLLPKLEETIFQLKTGEISSAIETGNGIYIFKLKTRYPAESSALVDVKEKIYNRLFQEKFREKYKEWIEKLRKAAYVEIKS